MSHPPHDAAAAPEGATSHGLAPEAEPERTLLDPEADRRHLLAQLRGGTLDPAVAETVVAALRDGLHDSELAEAVYEGRWLPPEPLACEEEKGWAKVPHSVIVSGLDDICFRLYVLADERQRGLREPLQGIRHAARLLGKRHQTVIVHVGHLVDARLMREERDGQGQTRLVVVHNPARGFRSDTPPPPTPVRYRGKSNHPGQPRASDDTSDLWSAKRTTPPVVRQTHHLWSAKRTTLVPEAHHRSASPSHLSARSQEDSPRDRGEASGVGDVWASDGSGSGAVSDLAPPAGDADCDGCVDPDVADEPDNRQWMLHRAMEDQA